MNDGKPIIIPNDQDSQGMFAAITLVIEQLGPQFGGFATPDDPTGYAGALATIAGLGFQELVNKGMVKDDPARTYA